MAMHPDDRKSQLRDLLDRLEGPLLRYAQRLTGRLDLAREIVQDAFMRLCVDERGWSTNPTAWLFAVVRNRSIDVHRKESRMQLVDAAEFERRDATATTPANTAEQRDTSAAILRLLSALPMNQQEAIRLKFQADLSYKEIASIMSLTATNVGFLIHTGLKTVRSLLEAESSARRSTKNAS